MAGLSLFLVAVLAGAWWLQREQPYVAPGDRTDGERSAPALAAEAVERLERAIEGGDTPAGAVLGADDAARALLSAVVDNGVALRLRDLDLRYVDEAAAGADGSWQAAVEVRWRLAGLYRTAARSEVTFGFRLHEGRVLVTSVGGGDGRTPLWFTGPLEVGRGPGTLVLAAGGESPDRYAAWARRAVTVVRRVLPGWRGGLVVEVPADPGQLHEALAAAPGTYDGIAAVTTSVDGSLAPEAPVHVFVNPAVFGGLRPTGAQVVMSHEAVHVATGAAQAVLPLWLAEGFADYVALRDVDLPLRTTAGQIIEQVRRDGPPAALPGPAEFETTRSHLGATYEAAWQACVLLAERAGEQALVGLYRRVEGGEPLGRVLRDETGLTEADLTRLWQERLRDLAG